MIKSNSPYYIITPFVSVNTGLTCESYTLHVTVWDGLKATPPSETTYEITKNNPTGSTGDDKINIARLISDFIEFAPQSASATGVIDGNNQQWVRTFVTYITTDPLDDTVSQYNETLLFSLGYSYGYEGGNITTITNDILLTPQDYKVDRNGVFVQPVLIDESSTPAYSVISYPNNEINVSATIPSSSYSNELVSYIWVQVDETTTDTYIEVIYNGQTTTLLIQDECKYTPIDIFFQNKEGAEQVITFFKERKDSITITDEEFESDRGQPSDGNHQFVRFNVQAQGKLSLNTGFLGEEMNLVMLELLLSERIWSYDGSDFIPLKIKTKNLEYKTRQKAKLINYSIDFEPSYNEINNI